MWAFSSDTVRQAARSLGPWMLLLFGVLAGWCGLGLAVLALGESASQARSIVGGTSQTFAAVITLWVLARCLDQDRRSGFGRAADCTAPGIPGRWAGRGLGSVAVGAIGCAVLIAALGLLSGEFETSRALHLLSTTTVALLLVGAWGLLLASIWSGGAVVLAGLLVWFLGHLPWGADGFVPGIGGRVMRGLLPGPRGLEAGISDIGSTLAAAGGVLLIALTASNRLRPTA